MNFVDWNFVLDTGGATIQLTPSNSFPVSGGDGIVANPIGIYFDFGSTASNYFFFETTSGGNYICFNDATGSCSGSPSLVDIVINSTEVKFSIGPYIERIGSIASTPLPGALPLFVSALGGLGFVGWRRQKSAA